MKKFSKNCKITHYVTTLTSEREVNIRTYDWVQNMISQGKNFKKISINQLNLLKTNDILYIHCQVLSPASQLQRKISQSLQQPSIEGKEIWHDFKQFADFLEKEINLNKNHQFLEIAACYTDKFAQDLCIELAKRNYTDIRISGYVGQLYLNKGKILAGLIPSIDNPMILKNRFDGIINHDHPSYEGGWHINYELSNHNNAITMFQEFLCKKSFYSRDYIIR